MSRLAAAVAALALCATVSAATTLPPDFVLEDVTPGPPLVQPTGLAFLPDTSFLVAEKRGQVWRVKAGVRTLVWNGEAEVLDNFDRGLLDVGVDPNFATNRRVYFLFTADPDSNGVDDDDDAFGRLVRYQLDGSNVVIPASRAVLFGTWFHDGPASGSTTHTIGSLRWGEDGTLLVSAGEGAQFSGRDIGGRDPGLFTAGRVDPYEDVGAYRAQMITSLAGKVLRLDPATGHGVPSNPFWDGDPKSERSRVWLYGLRNPFRFAVRPGSGQASPSAGDPGTLFVGDVGWTLWEELDVVTGGGVNLGWPCYEGFSTNTEYTTYIQPPHHDCSTIGTPINPGPLQGPVLVTHHTNPNLSQPPGVTGNAMVAGDVYAGTAWPAAYRGAMFYADYGGHFIRAAVVDSAGQLLQVLEFASDVDEVPVAIVSDPVSRDLFLVGIASGHVHRVRFTGVVGNTPPVAVASGDPTTGVAPLEVSFTAAGSFDPDDDPIGFAWAFGDGGGTPGAAVSHTYATPGSYSAVLTVTDDRGGLARDTVVVVVGVGSGAFPATTVLDTFDRANGPIGTPWNASSNMVVDSQAATQNPSGPAWAVWPIAFGTTQEAYFRISAASSSAHGQGVMLKGQGTNPADPHVAVRYVASQGTLTVETLEGTTWTPHGSPLAVAFARDDVLGARAHADGRVVVYRNGVPIHQVSIAGWPWASGGGRIGLLLHRAGGARHDDFGGGTVLVANTAPTATFVHPASDTFFVVGDRTTLLGSGSDAESPGSLSRRFELRIHHNNHVHPGLVFSGDSAWFEAELHDDGTGSFYEASYIVADPQGLADTARVELHPLVELTPKAIYTVPTRPGDAAPATWRMRIANRGGMPSLPVRWRLVAGATMLAEGDVSIPAHVEREVAAVVPPMLPPGEHLVRFVVDTLGIQREPDESDNAMTRVVTVVAGAGSDEGAPQFVSGPEVEPAGVRAIVRWRTDEPAAGLVRYGTTPALGLEANAPTDSVHALALESLTLGARYYFDVTATDSGGAFTTTALDSFETQGGPLAADEDAIEGVRVSAAIPNPTRGAVRFRLELPRATDVRMTVYDLAGRIVWRDEAVTLAAGRHQLEWNGRESAGPCAPGMYLARIEVGGRAWVRRVALMR